MSWCQASYCKDPGPRECRWIPRMWNKDCFQDHGFCMINNENKCEWKRNRKLKTCLRENNIVFPWKTQRKTPTREVTQTGNESPGEDDSNPGFGLVPEEFNPRTEDRSPGFGAHSPGYGAHSPGYNSPGYEQDRSPRGGQNKLPDGFMEPWYNSLIFP